LVCSLVLSYFVSGLVVLLALFSFLAGWLLARSKAANIFACGLKGLCFAVNGKRW